MCSSLWISQFLVAFEYDKVMPVAFVVAEEQVLAMGGVYVFPVFQCLFYCRQRRVCEQFVTDAVGRKKVQCLGRLASLSCVSFSDRLPGTLSGSGNIVGIVIWRGFLRNVSASVPVSADAVSLPASPIRGYR